MSMTLMDCNSVSKFFNYNLNKSFGTGNDSLSINRFNYTTSTKNNNLQEALITTYSKILPSKFTTTNTLDFSFFLKIPNISSILSAENDSKQYSNNFKYLLNFKHKKKNVLNLNSTLNNLSSSNDNISSVDPTNLFVNTLFNTENTLKFKDYKSSNAQFLGSERTVRLLNNLNSNSYK
jgi:hypothetical protein